MLLSPIKNCNDFFTRKPPMVIFLICLVLMMLATFSLTVYIKHTNEIVNTDAEQNWISLRAYLNNSEPCMNDENHEIAENDKHFVEEVSFVTLITINLTQFKNTSRVQIFYSLDGWRPMCPIDYNEQTTLKVSFTVPQTLNETDGDKVCAVVKGPNQYLPKYSIPACEPHVISSFAPTTTLYTESNKDTHFCQNNKVRVLYYNDESNDNFAIFLSQNDKNIIYVHLMWCSYILLFFILVMLLYAVFYQYEDQQMKYRT